MIAEAVLRGLKAIPVVIIALSVAWVWRMLHQ